ncbi:RNA-directed DNA polymerase [Dickeya dianthicola]|uniref:retron St85 family RNA-directed DNA polymerase n=1 Tax=Dickeya dianthicola TaxID=204039 RepID=UPI001369FAE1|nr:retron St85 family RNA-directed DNA polymerase [Dickeya dianthicola]MCI4188493.1 retron St85 family RNA-directed DNA polymerase [Dickeya dianthicola]MCI4238697.1 retron St85 family RNA-directed DNA polymerase [Dickeya dianthicola]MCI4254640.1 retron St85 family RNA-directed DNA polymerase [Dickeya dianthicola]MZG22053.1 RNA-directed DNA polymerase [Dickeya dianthicola]MZI87623.1 RNA-directed DNA polymerase [Dickeya dianthicola]
MNIKQLISESIDIPLSMIDNAISLARTHVKRFKLKKKNGKFRIIHQPSKKLKTIQYWLIYNIFKNMPIHAAATAYRNKTSILDNAERHKENKYFLKIDFQDFFHSLTFNDFLPFIDSWKSKRTDIVIDDELKEIIRKSCFYINDKLAIGYPSSPIISNIIMFDLDEKIQSIISDKKYGNVTYTRYSDDIIISTDKAGVCKEIYTEISTLIKSTNTPCLSINVTKTKFSSSSGGSSTVTGLRICHDQHITIHRKQKDHIRLLLSLYTKGILNEKDKNSLIGHLAYCHHVDPTFYSKLSKKYFKEIAAIRSYHIKTNALGS